ncbi:lysoplasmalogenase [Iamia majanohamensis]|uniref:Lysoplasmalogenase n=1 Tax=Iamia majanohamensis TaxID=467976 RepID=A0AAF0BUN0_9ACTN|nr:lysoplasmalogenase [Iamia majanohamensis]WCO65935.1 lysoplasmalogenase [Iamia majanohamensis]
MTATAAVLLALAGLAAVADWVAVAREQDRVRLVAKPLTLVLLLGVAATLDAGDGTVRAWFLAGLVLSLAGDVFLMLPDERRLGPVPPFLAGLGAFLLGHLAYIVGMATDQQSWVLTAVGVVVVVVGLGAISPRLLAGVARTDPALRGPVLGYMVVISLMVVAAFGRAVLVGMAGSLLFYVSDATLGWNRFVAPSRGAQVAVMVTYHLAQAGLVLSLLA